MDGIQEYLQTGLYALSECKGTQKNEFFSSNVCTRTQEEEEFQSCYIQSIDVQKTSYIPVEGVGQSQGLAKNLCEGILKQSLKGQ